MPIDKHGSCLRGAHSMCPALGSEGEVASRCRLPLSCKQTSLTGSRVRAPPQTQSVQLLLELTCAYVDCRCCHHSVRPADPLSITRVCAGLHLSCRSHTRRPTSTHVAAGAQLGRAAEPLLCRAGGSPVGGGGLWPGNLEQGQGATTHLMMLLTCMAYEVLHWPQAWWPWIRPARV